MADFPVVNFAQYQWEVNDQNYLIKWNNFQTAITTLQNSLDTFGGEVEQELADTLEAAEAVRQQAITDTNAIKATAVEAAGTATTKAGEASGSADAAAISAEEAQAAAAGDVISDTSIGPLTTFSSQKINSLLTLDDRLSFKSDFVRDEYFIDAGSRTFAPAEYVWDVVRASPTYALTANGKYREVPANTIARDWNPTAGQYEAQISGAVTNELLYSTQLDNAAWVKNNGLVVTSGATPSIIEGYFADKITPAAGTAFSRIYQGGVPYDPGAQLAWVLFKPSGYASVGLEIGGVGTVIYNSQTNSFDVVEASVDDYGSVVLSNGWHLVFLKLTRATSGTTTFYVYSLPGGITQASYSGYDGVSGAYIAHAQLETGTRPTSPIITEDAPVTRAADNISRELGAEFNGSAFTSIYSFYASIVTSISSIHVFSLSTDSISSGQPRASLLVASNGDRRIQVIDDAGQIWANVNISSLLNNGRNSIAVSVDVYSGSCIVALNGSILIETTGLTGSFSGIKRQWLQSHNQGGSFNNERWGLLLESLNAAQLQELTQ